MKRWCRRMTASLRRAQAVRGCRELTSLQLEVADGSAMTINLNRLLGASKARTLSCSCLSGVMTYSHHTCEDSYIRKLAVDESKNKPE